MRGWFSRVERGERVEGALRAIFGNPPSAGQENFGKSQGGLKDEGEDFIQAFFRGISLVARSAGMRRRRLHDLHVLHG